MKYGLRIPHSIADLILNLHPEIRKKIKYALRMILYDPDQGKELRYDLSGLRSFRVSKFRIIYRIGDDAIEIVAIGPRPSIYLETLRILKKQKDG